MKTALIILLGFLVIRFIISLINYIWFIKSAKDNFPRRVPEYSVLIPARNEAAVMGGLLSDLLSLSPAPCEIIVYDDNSEDETSVIVRSFSVKYSHIKLVDSTRIWPNGHSVLPNGWLGKNNACHRLASVAKGEYLLFLDADVRVNSSIIKYIKYACNNNLALLSIFPHQILGSKQDYSVTPLMNWILLSLLPLPLVKYSSWSSFSAANGQFMLFRRVIYNSILPHKKFRGSRAEDIEISRHLKKTGHRIATLTGDGSIRCHMYNSPEEAVKGFTKNVFHFFGGSVFLTILFLAITTLTVPFAFISGGLVAGVVSLVLIVAIRIFVSLASEQNVLLNILYMGLQHFYFTKIVSVALRNRRDKIEIWKGRNIYS